jgi:hypothetical protein
MKRTRKEQEAAMRSALDMLKRVGGVGDATTDEGDGPVNPYFAIGWAKASLQRALSLSDQPTGDV